MMREIEMIRSARKSVSIEIRPDLSIVVRAPWRMPDAQIRKFVNEKSGWIEARLEEMKAKREAAGMGDGLQKLTAEELKTLAERARSVIPERVAHFAPLVGADCGRITIRSQRSRWGSCSAKGNLNFNCLLMLAPPEVLDYVVVHELCHRLEMNHSRRFWAEVARVLPEYRKARAWLKDYGDALIGRL